MRSLTGILKTMRIPSGTPKIRARMALLPEETLKPCHKTGPQIFQTWIVVKRFWLILKDIEWFLCFFLKFHFHQATAPPKLSFNIFVQLLDICGTPKMRAHTALLPEETFRNCPKTGSQTSQMWIQCSGKVLFVNIEGFRCFCEISPGNSATEIRKTHQRCDGVPKRFLAKKKVGNEQFSRYRPITKVKR